MARDRPGAAGGLAALEHHDRLAAGLGRLEELAPLAGTEALNIEGDDLGLLVAGQVAEQVLLLEQGLVADADPQRHADAFGGETDHLIDQHAARLRDHGHVAELRGAHAFGGEEEGVDMTGRKDAQAVGPDEGKVGFAGHGHQAFLQVAVADLGEAARDDRGAADTGVDAILHDAGHILGAGRDHGHVDLARNIPDIGEGRPALENAGLGVDRKGFGRIAQMVLIVDDVGRVLLVMQ
ncbi:MAG: hypothetical protein BWY87_01367 [Deltaproteobacteria bacterium ADurb.Bin510]|nr:MAG: hypothetical protein BWY87_01367 [Deltaproteobacteria bacterium ADurb.Bin510]